MCKYANVTIVTPDSVAMTTSNAFQDNNRVFFHLGSLCGNLDWASPLLKRKEICDLQTQITFFTIPCTSVYYQELPA